MFSFGANSLKNRIGIENKLIEIGDLAIKISTIDFGYPQDAGIRTAEQQQQLFREGKSKADGYKNKSYHQTGKALDFYAYVDGKASWEPEYMSVIAAAHLQAASLLGYPLQWAGFWTDFRDLPHLQLRA